MEPRRLKGHKATATYCTASHDRPGLFVTAGEDGCVCWFDLRCKDAQLIMDVGTEPVSSLCFKPGNENIVYVSSGRVVKCLDVHLGASWKPLESYSYNKEEINQVACSLKSSFLAAADDGGDIKIIDMTQKCLYKTLRFVALCSFFHGDLGKVPQLIGLPSHITGLTEYTEMLFPFQKVITKNNILFIVAKEVCEYSVSGFRALKILKVITGGLDSKLVMWDFSRGRPFKIVDFGSPDLKSGSNTSSQCLNPAFVHSIAVPEIDMLEKSDKICAVARGDGVVDVINIESEVSSARSKSSAKPRKGSQPKLKDTTSSETADCNIQRLHLDHSMGGHTAAVSCVAFSTFGERGKFIISGSNDKSVKFWDWFKYIGQGQTTSEHDLLQLNINLTKKVNWVCTTPTDSENLIVCDTTKVVKVYSVS